MSAAPGVSCALVQSFGIGVRQLREAQGWSQERLAAERASGCAP